MSLTWPNDICPWSRNYIKGDAILLALFCWERSLKVEGYYKNVFSHCVDRRLYSVVCRCIGKSFVFLVKMSGDIFGITNCKVGGE